MNIVNFKVLLAGDEAVGKTSLIRRFVKNEFGADYKPTLGFEITSHSLQIDTTTLNFSIWDIAGQTTFESVRRKYYTGSQGFLLVFNLANRVSLRNLDYWGAEIRTICPDAPMLLLGNKADIPDQKVTLGEMQTLAKKIGAEESIATSAKTGQGVAEAFIIMGKVLLRRYQPKPP